MDMVDPTAWLRHPTGTDSCGHWCRRKTSEWKFVSIRMYRNGCHDVNWPHERPSLECLRGQLVGSIRTLEVGVTSNYLLNPCWLIMTADIDDRDQCLPGRSSQDKCSCPCDRAARSSRHTENSTGWLTYRRPRHCLRGQSIVVIVNVRSDLVRIVLLCVMWCW